METAPLKAFATKARIGLIKEIAGRISVVLGENSLARVEAASAVSALEKAIARDGLDRVTDQVAYTWFNRIIALRFMDANGYTGSGIVSPAGGQSNGQPEVLAEAKAGVFDDAIVPKKTQDSIAALFNGTRASQDRDGEAYGLLLEAYCRAWNGAMPFMFEREGDYTELLIPTALLAADSVRDRAVKTLTKEVCREVEVIGWLYQFYISDRKDEVFEGFKKNKKAGAAEIPAATQLFTPHWIVRYLVENSLGRLWLLNNPSSRLAEQMDYYIKPVDEETDFLRIAKPEELKVIDPAVGSGHMLTYAFDLLYAIYTERGYDPADIPGLILEHNLYGLEIDPRAGALAAFALTMKAAAKRKLFLKHPVQPNIRVLQNVVFDEAELDYLWSLTKAEELTRADADEFWNAFEHADTFGSLIQPKEQLVEPLEVAIESATASGDLFDSNTLEKAFFVVEQAEALSQRYSIVVANPPYMGVKNLGTILGEFTKRSFPRSKADLFAVFIERSMALAQARGFAGLVTMHSWMFISSFAKLREHVLNAARISNMAHLGTRAFDAIGGSVVATTAFVIANAASARSGAFLRLVDGENEEQKQRSLREAARSVDSKFRFERDSAWFLALPDAPISYWLSDGLVRSFTSYKALSDIASPRQGLATTDNGKFLRRWHEVSRSHIGFNMNSLAEAEFSGRRWFPYNKGGSARRWYGNHEFVVNWERDGAAIKQNIIRKYPYLNGNPNFVAKNTEYYFRPAISWSLIGTGPPSFRYYPSGFVFDVAGTSVFPNDSWELEPLLGYLNSSATESLLAAIAPTMNLVGGDIARVPVPPLVEIPQEARTLVERLIQFAKDDWDSTEESWEFEAPALLAAQSALAATTSRLALALATRAQEAMEFEHSLDTIFSAALGLEAPSPEPGATKFGAIASPSATQLVADLVSYSIGCMFGRYSLDKPGLILADQGSTLEEYLAQVPTPSFLPDRDNVIPIVDGDWFEDDIVARFRQFLRAAFGDEHFEENLQFVTESLGVKDIRDYFVKSFYDDHVKRYKKRPIYWLFRSPKGAFNALIYLHRYSPSTVSTVLTGYLREFIGKLEANLEHQGRVAAGMGGASARDIANAQKEADRIRKVLVELRDYEHDILFPLAGQQIALDLDDGVLVNYQKLGPALKDIGLKKGNSSE